MKKVISIVLVLVMALSLCACNSGGTKLTEGNVESYVDISCWIYPDNYYQRPINTANGKVYSDEPRSITACCKAEGLSTNFNYEGVVITIKVFGEYKEAPIRPNGFVSDSDAVTVPFEKTIKIRTDISGGGSINEKICDFTDKIILSYKIDYKIISVEGTVNPA